jgi:uncharacterized integral membrane protein
MELWQYCRRVFTLAFTRTWRTAEAITGILAIVLGIIVAVHPNWETTVKYLAWAIPLGMFVVIGLIRLAIAPWIIYKQQEQKIREQRDKADNLKRELEAMQIKRRPTIALGQKLGASTHPRDADKEVDIELHPTWHNIGEGVAYQLCLHSGWAPMEFPDEFVAMPDLNVPNPIYSTEEFGPILRLRQPFIQREDGKRQVKSKVILMYCGIEYSDAPQGGNKYRDEWWFAYPLSAPSIAAAHMEQKQALEPHVRKAFGEKNGWTTKCS